MKHRIRKMRFDRWSIPLVLISIVLLIALDVLYFVTYTQNVEDAFEESISQTIEQIRLNVMNQFVLMENLTSYLALNSTINRALSPGSAPQSMDAQYDEMQALRALLRACSTVNRDLSSRLYVDSSKMYAHEREFFYPLTELVQNPLFAQVGFQSSFVLYPETVGNNEEYRICCIRLIRSLSNVGTSIGAVATVIDEKDIWSSLSAFETDGRSIYLIDRNMRVISCGDKQLIGRPSALPGQADAAGSRGAYQGKSGQIVYTKPVGTTEWNIVCEVQPTAYPGHTVFRGPVFLAFALSCLMLAAMGYVYSRFIQRATDRVNVLSNVFKGETMVELPVTRFPLFKQFDESINNACELVQSGYEQMKLQVRMQSQLLQLQINPHLLYNSLDTVLWLVRKGDTKQSERMISAMSRYLRLILNNGNDTVTLKDEIDLMNAYIEMQKISCPRLVSDFMADQEAESLYLPKLTLQPIAENAILHGIIPDHKPTGRIDVLCYTENQALYVVITDNGVGIPKEQLAKMAIGFDRTDAYGLYNVDQRIKLFSGGNDYGVSIVSTEGVSTTVTLKIAIKRALQEDTEIASL